MTAPKDIFAAHKYPGFVKNHAVFKKIKSVKKIFPEIGLPNCEEEVVIDNSKEIIASATSLVGEVQNAITKRATNIKKWVSKKELSEKRKKKFEECSHLLGEMKGLTGVKNRKKFLITNNGRYTLNLPADVLDVEKKPAFKTGEGLFRAYNKLNDVLRDGKFVAMDKLENMYSFKDFSSKNIPAKKHRIVFSSDGTDGAWDIATMSMRGINSCQSWGPNNAPGNSQHIVGSIVDPFTGIIYLTAGAKFNEYGSKMIRRCIVRFVVDRASKKPYLMLERMYPSDDNSVIEAFTDFLKKRIDGKFDVIYCYANGGVRNKYVPMSKAVETLDQYSTPYCDSAVSYEIDSSDKRYLKESMKNESSRIIDEFSGLIGSSIGSLKLTDFSKDMHNAVRSMKNIYAIYTLNYISPLLKKKIKVKTKAALIEWLGKNLTGLVSEGLFHMDLMLGYKLVQPPITRMIVATMGKKYKAFAKKEIAKIEKEKPIKIQETIYTKLLDDNDTKNNNK